MHVSGLLYEERQTSAPDLSRHIPSPVRSHFGLPTINGAIHTLTDFLALAYERFLANGDEALFKTAIQQQGGAPPPPDLDCPITHRIRDALVCGEWYRVVRVYNDNG